MLAGLEYEYFECTHCRKHFPYRYAETVFPAWTSKREGSHPQLGYFCEPCFYEMLRGEIYFCNTWDGVIRSIENYSIRVTVKIVTKGESLCRVQLDLGRKRVTGQTNIMSPLRKIKEDILDLVHELEVAKPYSKIGFKNFLSFLREAYEG